MKEEKNKGLRILGLVLCAIIHVILAMITGPFSTEQTTIYNGVLAQVQVILSVIMVTTCFQQGFITACIVNAFSALSGLSGALHNPKAIPGVIIPIITIATITIIYTNLSQNRTITQELKDQYEKSMDANRVMQEKDEAIRAIAYTDTLTGMYNMRYFREKIDEAIRLNMAFTVIYTDIDNFKTINDTFGPKTGDAALKIYADRVAAYCGRRSVCARTNGDEFGIILTGEQSEADVMNTIEQLRAIFGKQITAQMTTLSVTASFGVVSFPKDGSDTETLLDHAVMAVYNAKANGKDRPCFFS